MSSDRIKGRSRSPVKSIRREDGRYVRWSWRYSCYQYFSAEAGVWCSVYTCQTETMKVPDAQVNRHYRT
jgi:hypothetical protein